MKLFGVLLLAASVADAFHLALPAKRVTRGRVIVAAVNSWYDSGLRLTANGGVMDVKVVPADEERWGGV